VGGCCLLASTFARAVTRPLRRLPRRSAYGDAGIKALRLASPRARAELHASRSGSDGLRGAERPYFRISGKRSDQRVPASSGQRFSVSLTMQGRGGGSVTRSFGRHSISAPSQARQNKADLGSAQEPSHIAVLSLHTTAGPHVCRTQPSAQAAANASGTPLHGPPSSLAPRRRAPHLALRQRRAQLPDAHVPGAMVDHGDHPLAH
jgi:hypothetical protein